MRAQIDMIGEATRLLRAQQELNVSQLSTASETLGAVAGTVRELAIFEFSAGATWQFRDLARHFSDLVWGLWQPHAGR